MQRSTGMGARENRMLVHTGHGLCMLRNTGVRAGGNKMIRVHGKLLLDVKKRVGAGDNKMCMEKNLCTPTFSSLLLQPKCFSISICNDSYILIISLSPALTSVLPYIHESSHMCSDILFSPAPTPVLLLIYEQCSMYSNHFIITCSNCIASPHE